jgi:hypothetical protein
MLIADAGTVSMHSSGFGFPLSEADAAFCITLTRALLFDVRTVLMWCIIYLRTSEILVSVVIWQK